MFGFKMIIKLYIIRFN